MVSWRKSYRGIYLDHGVLPFHMCRNPIMYMYNPSEVRWRTAGRKYVLWIYSKGQ